MVANRCRLPFSLGRKDDETTLIFFNDDVNTVM